MMWFQMSHISNSNTPIVHLLFVLPERTCVPKLGVLSQLISTSLIHWISVTVKCGLGIFES